MPHAASLRAPLLWTAYVLLPVSGWGFFHGVPLGLPGAAALFAIWWTWSLRGPLPGRRWMFAMLLAMLLAKIAASFLLTEHGFEASYYANDRWAAPVERSTEFRSGAFTRIDRSMSFGPTTAFGRAMTDGQTTSYGTPGRTEFPLYFFNDSGRFPPRPSGEANRAALPFSVTWQGDIWTRENAGTQSFFLRASALPAELWVDGVLVVAIQPPATEATWRAAWPAGRHRVLIRLTVPAGSAREFEAGLVDATTNQKTAFQEHEVVAKLYPPWRIVADRALRPLSRAIDAVLLVVLTIATAAAFLQTAGRVWNGVQRREAIAGLLSIAAFTGGLSFASPAARHVILLSGDALRYEHQARDIALNGVRMLITHGAGEGGVFSFGLYAWLLALVHLVFGEDLAGVQLIQWLLACVTVLGVWRMTTVLFGESIGRVALALAGLLLIVKLVPLARSLASENLSMPLVIVWVLLLIYSATRYTPGKQIGMMVGVGVLATLARPTLLPAWVLALPFLVLSRRAERSRGTAEGLRGLVRWLPACVVLGQLGMAALSGSHAYAGTSMLPAYLPALPYAAAVLMWTADFLVPADPPPGDA